MLPKVPKPARRSNIQSSAHDPETGQLTVTFHNGRKYRYDGVDAELAGKFKEADTQGGFLHKHILGKCEGCEIFD